MKSLKSVGTLAGMGQLREKIARLIDERKEVAAMPVTHSEAHARIDQHVVVMAAGYSPGDSRSSTPPRVRVERCKRRQFEPGFYSLTEFDSLEQLGCVIAPDAMREFLHARLDTELEGAPKGIATAEREQQLAKLDAEILKLGVEEEVAICAFEESGLDMDRRGDADPEIVLEVEFDDSEPLRAA